LLKPTARRLNEASLVTQDDNRVALRYILTRLELLEFERFSEQGEELCNALVPVVSTSPRDHGRALQSPFYIVGQKP
jgi:hypothetical protein